MKQYKLIAVNAQLKKKRGVEEQVAYLRATDTSIPKVEALSGRKNVWDMPEVFLPLAIFPAFFLAIGNTATLIKIGRLPF